MRISTPLVLVLAALAAACCGHGNERLAGPGDRNPGGITVTSDAFVAGGAVPERYTCEGENVPPPLAWTAVPSGTRTLALIVEDPEAPDGVFVHWLVVGIDPSTTTLRGTAAPTGASVLPGSSDNPTYIGPCPPDGENHHYHFEVYALPGQAPVDPDGDPVDNVRAVRRAATAGGDLVGTYAR